MFQLLSIIQFVPIKRHHSFELKDAKKKILKQAKSLNGVAAETKCGWGSNCRHSRDVKVPKKEGKVLFLTWECPQGQGVSLHVKDSEIQDYYPENKLD